MGSPASTLLKVERWICNALARCAAVRLRFNRAIRMSAPNRSSDRSTDGAMWADTLRFMGTVPGRARS